MTIDRNLLDPGESVVWSGRPNALRYALTLSWYTFLFGIFFFGFSLVWISIAWGKAPKDGNFFFLFGIPFVVIGAGLVLSPLWHLWRGARATYALTNRRAVTVIDGLFARRLSVPLSQIRFVDVRASVSGFGNVYFKETAVPGSEGGTTIKREGFIAIPDVPKVERLLRAEVDRAASTQQRYSS
jgi:hypothetical protein